MLSEIVFLFFFSFSLFRCMLEFNKMHVGWLAGNVLTANWICEFNALVIVAVVVIFFIVIVAIVSPTSLPHVVVIFNFQIASILFASHQSKMAKILDLEFHRFTLFVSNKKKEENVKHIQTHIHVFMLCVWMRVPIKMHIKLLCWAVCYAVGKMFWKPILFTCLYIPEFHNEQPISHAIRWAEVIILHSSNASRKYEVGFRGW